jgi:threonine/homoserine/homoserine lactone efflux protein
MNYNLLFAFLIGMTILAATPGPGVFASMARAMTEGFRVSLFFIGGLVIGDICFLLLALLGLSAAARMLGSWFLIIRIAGGVYLIYLGFRMFRTASFQYNSGKMQGGKKWQAFVGGIMITIGNPKPLLFYASVLPTIINFDDVRISDALIMITLIAVVSFTVLGTYSYIASLSNKLGMSERAQKTAHQFSGFIMMTVGLYVIIF